MTYLLLRDYQQTAVDTAITWHKYKDTPCIIDIATGGGKSHIIAALADYYAKQGLRVCILAHRKRLLTQNAAKLTMPYGYYSAGIGEKNADELITVAGIQSIWAADVKKYDVIITDECHRLPNNQDEGQYWRFYKTHSPAKFIGLTATPYRLQGGKLGWGEPVYSVKYPELLKLGFLAPLINKVKDTPDLSRVTLVANEYNEGMLSEVMADPKLVESALQNIIAYGKDRKTVIIFCVSVMHAKAVMLAMLANNMQAELVSSETPEDDRDRILDDFCNGKIRYLINCEILLEGFDAPNIDMIVCLRPTKSKALHEQMLGRGVRKHDSKENCFLLDMAGNLMEHGGLGSPFYDKSKKEQSKSKGRICPECETFNKINAKECEGCGFIFPEAETPKANHNHAPDTETSAAFAPLVEYEVHDVRYREHRSKSGNTTLKIDYMCATKYGAISEWLSPYSDNEWARSRAKGFMKQRGWDVYGDIKEYKIDDIIWHCDKLKKPIRIIVDHSEKYPRVKGYVYEDENRGGDSKGAGEVATDILGGDLIPF